MASYTAQSRETGRVPLPIDTARSYDRTWWVQPLLTVLALSAFGVYTTVRAFESSFFCYPWIDPHGSIAAAHHLVESSTYLSPFNSPFIAISWKVGRFLVPPAFYILIFPLAFRMTCYYYRKAYYRSFFWDPPACAISEPMSESRRKYLGERAFPFVLQNLHRFAFYAAAIFIFILAYDVVKAFRFVDNGVPHFGMGVGTLILLVNDILLGMYTFGCHAWRHLVGGAVDCYSCSGATKTRYGLWKQVSFLNKRHALYAWLSMGSVLFADVYVNLVARGIITDLRIF